MMLHVTCAVIEHNDKILICQRSAQMKLPLKWEFPGGKIEAGERKEDCLKREIREELGLEIEVQSPLTPVQHRYADFSLCLYPFHCTWTGGDLAMMEHAQALWVEKSDLKHYDWAEADVPVVNEIICLGL
ncbi:(deoxy)nucleoside triphosphate pyrophosphohydrolase [Sphingobacterium allocomposti]|jgi:8-oxo-dGTP diphosphatase|nr:(deoxy)nucleoside triphosphate pyrophosphohydrolase [Sphingobacterium composti Yoo et al. 2007 non Ten et al. 2007]HLS95003.1 (deoxy)nucleoside triphosphate pyrophosphohydrolase [Sphingobacterium sp.]